MQHGVEVSVEVVGGGVRGSGLGVGVVGSEVQGSAEPRALSVSTVASDASVVGLAFFYGA